MKKIALFAFVASLVFIVSCGQSAKEIKEKQIKDSIVADSTAHAMFINDSIVRVEFVADSLKNDSISKATTKTKKKK